MKNRYRGVCGIYLIWDSATAKGYVGQAVDIGRRWTFHLWELNANRHTNRKLQSAWNDHAKAFAFSLLEQCDKSSLNEREQFWVSELCTYTDGYNLTTGGDNAEKPEGFGETLSRALKGRTSPLKGKKFSDEHRAKISNKLKGNHNSGYGADNHASKPVVNLDTGEYFSCANEAGRACGSKSKHPGSNIISACNGRRDLVFGYHWAYAGLSKDELKHMSSEDKMNE